MPSSLETWEAGFPLVSQWLTASRLKLSSNLRRTWFMDLTHSSANSLSVNSKQPHLAHQEGYLSGGGTTLVLRKKDGKWTSDKSIGGTWDS
jgi:hypothetical protein